MPRNGLGVYALPPATAAIPSDPIGSAKYNTLTEDLAAMHNEARPIAQGGTGATTAAAARTALGVPATSAVQPLDAALTSLAGLTLAANKGLYATGADTVAMFDLTAAGRALLDDADATAQRATLGLGAAAVAALATQIEAETGTDNTTAMTPLRTAQAIPAKLNATGAAPMYACRAWVNFNGTGTVAIRASGNVSSITDNGTGDYTVNFTIAMPDANYAVSGAAGRTGVTSMAALCTNSALNVGNCRVSAATANGTLTDNQYIHLAFHR